MMVVTKSTVSEATGAEILAGTEECTPKAPRLHQWHNSAFVSAMLTTLSNPKQEAVKAAIIEEQKRGEKAMAEAVKRTRDELVEYLREQRRVSPRADPPTSSLYTALRHGQSSGEQFLLVLDSRGSSCVCGFRQFL